MYGIFVLRPLTSCTANPDINGIINHFPLATAELLSIGTIKKYLTGSMHPVIRIFLSLSLILPVSPLNVTVSLFLHSSGTDNRQKNFLEFMALFCCKRKFVVADDVFVFG